MTTAWRSIHNVVDLISGMCQQFIQFPPRNQHNRVAQKFRQKFNFPGVIGCVDGTHIPVLVPKDDVAETYRNRKGFMSLNVQMVCGPNSEIYDITANWPGSAHDAAIWTSCDLNGKLSSGMASIEHHLLGDSAYPLKEFLLTPYKNPSNSSQVRYNKRHSSTRMAIEKAYGQLKRRFPLLKNGLKFRKIADSANCVVVAVCLYNFCKAHQDTFEEKKNFHAEEVLETENYPADIRGSAKRDRIVNYL